MQYVGFLLPIHVLKCNHFKWYQLCVYMHIMNIHAYMNISCLKMVASFYWVSIMCRHCTRFSTLSFISQPLTKIDIVSTDYSFSICLSGIPGAEDVSVSWTAKNSSPHGAYIFVEGKDKETEAWRLMITAQDSTVYFGGSDLARSSWFKTCILYAISFVYLLVKYI